MNLFIGLVWIVLLGILFFVGWEFSKKSNIFARMFISFLAAYIWAHDNITLENLLIRCLILFIFSAIVEVYSRSAKEEHKKEVYSYFKLYDELKTKDNLSDKDIKRLRYFERKLKDERRAL